MAEFAYAAGSRLVFAAGACPLNEDGVTVGVGDVRVQAIQAVANLQVSLRDAGASLKDIVRTTVYVASREQRDVVAAWEVVRDALAPHDPPSPLLGVAALGYPDQLVEVERRGCFGGLTCRLDLRAVPVIIPLAARLRLALAGGSRPSAGVTVTTALQAQRDLSGLVVRTSQRF